MNNCKRKVDRVENAEMVNYANSWDLEIKKYLNLYAYVYIYIHTHFMVFFSKCQHAFSYHIKCFLRRVQCMCA